MSNVMTRNDSDFIYDYEGTCSFDAPAELGKATTSESPQNQGFHVHQRRRARLRVDVAEDRERRRRGARGDGRRPDQCHDDAARAAAKRGRSGVQGFHAQRRHHHHFRRHAPVDAARAGGGTTCRQRAAGGVAGEEETQVLDAEVGRTPPQHQRPRHGRRLARRQGLRQHGHRLGPPAQRALRQPQGHRARRLARQVRLE
mmetsp:Transcript_4618/g.14474  ORF Transcript_4618/g.14474 Transcript_4618/m.14474 type:complete len:200 (-) Transcript_4618:170-769(-)